MAAVIETIYIHVTLWIAILIFMQPLKHKPNYGIRAALSVVVGSVLCILTALLDEGVFANAGIGFLIYFALTIAMFYVCIDLPFFDMLYGSVWAVMTQQAAYEVWQVLQSRVEMFGELFQGLGKVPGSMVVFGAIYVIVAATVARHVPENGRYRTGPRQLSSAILLLAVFEILYVVLFENRQLRLHGISIAAIGMAQLYCVTVLYLQTELFKKSAMKQEMDLLNHLWHQQKMQYSLAKENIALINHKCHDLKHQMKAL